MHEHYDIIDTVHLTEKASLLSEKHNQYVFRVAPHANKIQIKRAVEKLFGKGVVSVNTCRYSGKTRHDRRSARPGRTNHWKKAIVTLKAGERIELA
jgi:large subunit ribosomal protein L23